MGTGGWVLLERGTLVCWGDKSSEEVEEEKVGGLLLSCRLPDFGIQVDEDRLWLCSDKKKIRRVIRKALAMLYLG